MSTLLPVSWRRALGMTVNGPKPGLKRHKHTGLVLVQQGTVNYHEVIPALDAGTGILIPATCWRKHHVSFNAFEVDLRMRYRGRRLSIRLAKAQGGRQDVLVLRTA